MQEVWFSFSREMLPEKTFELTYITGRKAQAKDFPLYVHENKNRPAWKLGLWLLKRKNKMSRM